jgi:hypothetical protein
MSNENQNRPQQTQQPRQPKPDDQLRVRVKVGKVLKEHKGDGEDEFYQTGEEFAVTRAYYEQHIKARTYDSYHRPDGSITSSPETRKDQTIEIVEDPIETHNKSLNRAA